MTVRDCRYPITMETIVKICAAHGEVVRGMISRKNGVQALVEFPSVEIAYNVKHKLYGFANEKLKKKMHIKAIVFVFFFFIEMDATFMPNAAHCILNLQRYERLSFGFYSFLH